MDDKLNKILSDNSPKINEWIDKINIYNSSYAFDNLNKYSEVERINILFGETGVLRKISELLIKYRAFTDKFDNRKMYLNIEGPSLIIKSEKTNNTFNRGIGNKGIYLDTYSRHAENIRHMDDSFYSDILSLEKLGKFDLIENEHYGRETTNKYPCIYNNHKSKLFKIFRNYFVGTVEQRENILLDQFQIT